MTLFANYVLHHVGIVLPTFDAAEEFMGNLGMTESYRGFVEPWSCWCLFTQASQGPSIELVIPEGGELAKFNKGVGGLHHYAYEVPDIYAISEELRSSGMTLLEPEPIKGAGNFLCNFIHPFSTRGIRIELVQPL